MESFVEELQLGLMPVDVNLLNLEMDLSGNFSTDRFHEGICGASYASRDAIADRTVYTVEMETELLRCCRCPFNLVVAQ